MDKKCKCNFKDYKLMIEVIHYAIITIIVWLPENIMQLGRETPNGFSGCIVPALPS